MNGQSSIDSALRLLGNATPPSGMEQRIHARLQVPRKGFTAIHAISSIAIAASVTVAVLVLTPLMRMFVLHSAAGQPGILRSAIHPGRGFGSASAVKVPTAPIPVQPVPPNQGRGHARSDRGALQPAAHSPLPRGVALPRNPRVKTAKLYPEPQP